MANVKHVTECRSCGNPLSKIIFDVMADVKNYSHILPQNIKNVTIIEIKKMFQIKCLYNVRSQEI